MPESTLVHRGELTGLFVVRDGQAWLRWVRPGRAEGGEVEVLAGLWPGEEVVVSPQGLADGTRVRAAR